MVNESKTGLALRVYLMDRHLYDMITLAAEYVNRDLESLTMS
jgi:hypothetical protein